MNNLVDEFKAEAETLYPSLVSWRRDFHRHPELGFQEVRTARVVTEHLQSLGLEVSTGIGQTGVVAVVEPDHLPEDTATVLLRFDMDALPIHEENDVDYRSKQDGVMHACGHDGHTAIGMGVAQILARHRQKLRGRVKLVFQPAEEGLGGARAMIADGVMDNPRPGAAFGLHLWSRLPLNQIVVQSGPLWASAGSFTLTVNGRGGHGAMPHETVDATLIASQIVVAWQSIVARNIDPTDTAVLSVGTLHSGTASNVISANAEMSGTIRAFDDHMETLLLQRMQEIASGICQGFGASYEFDYAKTVPVTRNSPEGAALMEQVAARVVGEDNVVQIAPMMVGEDMSEFLNEAPGCFIIIGASDPASAMHSPHHNPTFNFDERVMLAGVATLSGVAMAYLDREA